MNIAIILGVSEYTDSRNNLPGCRKDVESIHNIINKTSKYDEILFIHEKLSSAKVKEKLTYFISECKLKKIEELFFYYSGHGEFQDDEFYYILSDYNQDKKNQTSLQNEELDSLFKTLNPSLIVKVLDACQSGKSYIKEAGAITKYFQKTINKFNKCYFLNSSLKDQSSFQTDIISDFTLSFIKSIKDHDTTEIRYKDIIDYISDVFEKNTSQTPFFVIQADYTEKFCIINPSLKEYLENLDTITVSEVNKKENNISLVEKIKKESLEYLTKEQAIKLINEIKDEMNIFKLKEELNDIYNMEITFQENYDGIINKNTIAKWLVDNQHDYFAKSIYTTERKERHSNLFSNYSITNPFENDYVTVLNGFDLEVEVPYKTIFINLNSKYPNIDSFTSRIVYLLSKRQIRFFYFFTNFETKNWDERKLNTKIEWSTSEYALNDKKNIIDGLFKIFSQLEDKIINLLEEKFNKIEPLKE